MKPPIPSAQEFILQSNRAEWPEITIAKLEKSFTEYPLTIAEVAKLMQEFAQLHVEAALEMAAEKANLIDYGPNAGKQRYRIEKLSIRKAYLTDRIY